MVTTPCSMPHAPCPMPNRRSNMFQVRMSDYYQENYAAYHEKTFSIDPSSFLEPFASRLAKDSLVLDLGCGSGRDLLWLKKRGFSVVGFERSEGLARLARENADCEVMDGDFETYDFSSLSVEAILASGSFVHLPHSRLPGVLKNVQRALGRPAKNRSLVYISLKKGRGEMTSNDGRVFYLWQDRDLRTLFSRQGLFVLDFLPSESLMGTGEVWLGYVLELNERD